MSDVRLIAIAGMGVGLAAVSAWMHIKGQDGGGWGAAAFLCWLVVLMSN